MARHIRILAGKLDRQAGSHVYHQELIRRLAARGYRVSVLCFEAVPEVRGCAEVFEVSSRVPEWPFLWRLTALFAFLRCVSGMKRLELDQPDVVVAGEHLFLYEHARRFPQTPWMYLPHSLVVEQEIEGYRLPPAMHWVTNQLYTRLQRWALAHADRTLRFTRWSCEVLADSYGGRVRPRFVVNPMGIAMPGHVDERKAAHKPVRLLYIGQLIHRKRVEWLPSILAGVREEAWRCDIVGDGPLRRELEEKIGQLGLNTRVQFHGFQPEPDKWYRQADLLLLPSRSENSPVVVLEAMSYGVPCLAFKADGLTTWHPLHEILDHGRTGLLATDQEDFGRLLRDVLRGPEMLIQIGQAARRYALEHHSWERHLDRYEELFEELLVGQGRRQA
jgi:glycosyltransferase involved in cell wall biosynthesis